MKSLILSHSLEGGGGSATYRLHQALQVQGLEVRSQTTAEQKFTLQRQATQYRVRFKEIDSALSQTLVTC